MVPEPFNCIKPRSALAELRCATGAFETVFLSFFHSRVSGKESCLFEGGTKLFVILKERAGNTVADCACLTGNSAAAYAADDVKLLGCVCKSERLTYDELESFKTEIIVYVSVVDCDFAGARVNAYSGY